MAERANITVGFTRRPGFPKEEFSTKGFRAVDQYLCEWDERLTLAKQLLGFRTGLVTFSPKLYDSGDGTDIFNVFCQSVDIEPHGSISESTTSGHNKAVLTVVFDTVLWDLNEAGETYISESLEPASEFMTVGTDGLFWDAAKTKPIRTDAAPVKIVRMTDWVYTIHNVYVLPDWVWTHPGTVNTTSTTSRELERTFAAETLLCGNPTSTREITSLGTTAWTVTIRMTYRAEGWNNFPDPSVSGDLSFVPIYDSSGSVKLFYEKKDFNAILL